MLDADFETTWQQVTSVRFTQFGLEVEEEAPIYCPAAQEFANWVETHILSVKEDPNVLLAKTYRDEETINQAKQTIFQARLWLEEAFWRAYFYLPSSHQRHMGDGGHRCVFHVYKQAFLELHHLLRWVMPEPIAIVRTVVKEKPQEIVYQPMILGEEWEELHPPPPAEED